jgi:hypothetical protein
VLTFHFWRDDWGYIWGAQFHQDQLLRWTLHPGTWLEDVMLFPLFGWNPLPWNILGIVLRIFASISVSLMLYGLTRSKKIATIAGLFFASSYIGGETVSWSSVHIVPVIITITCVGIYFYASNLYRKNWKSLAIALGCFSAAVLADPGRSIPIVGLVILFEAIEWYLGSDKKKVFSHIKRILLVVISYFLATQLLLPTHRIRTDFPAMYQIITNNLGAFKIYLGSLGNMLVGWVIPVFEYGGLSNYNRDYAHYALYAIVLGTIASLLYGVIKKSRSALLITAFIAWILVYYFPNWFFERGLVVGGTHRYVGFAGVGLIAIFAILVGSLKNKVLSTISILIFLVLNIITTNRIMSNESNHRAYNVIEPLWQKIDKEIPAGETNGILMLMGSDGLRGSAFDWAGTMPIADRRGISDPYQVFIPTSDYDLIVKLVCEDNVNRPSVGKWEYQKERIPLHKVHAWFLENGKLENVTSQEHQKIINRAKETGCILTDSK